VVGGDSAEELEDIFVMNKGTHDISAQYMTHSWFIIKSTYFMFTESRQREVWSDSVYNAQNAGRVGHEGTCTRLGVEQYKGALTHPELQMLCCLQNEAQ
jgi:hypothetical protein